MLYQLAIERDLQADPSSGEENISDKEAKDFLGWLKITRHVADDFSMKAVHDRIGAFEKRIMKGIRLRDAVAELRVLRETIDSGLNGQLIYRYPEDKRVLFENWKNDWAPVIKSYKSAQPDIYAAIDCWALGHSTAGVFHSMRILEHGLRALAVNVGRRFDVQNWQNIIDQIESEIRALGKTLPSGISKTERLRFLSEAAKEFSFFKDGWRNHVSHNRATYDEYQARTVIEHVRAFMVVLSSQLSEQQSSK